MAKTDRLLSLVQALRRRRRPVTAEALAAELEVSVRTIYRDIAALMANRVPVRGEAGVGYVLDPGYDLPPMMFTPDEVEAILVGLRWLRERADVSLSRAADDVLAKIGAVLPEALKPVLFEGALFAPAMGRQIVAEVIDIAPLRVAIRKGFKAEIEYADACDRLSTRIIWPCGLAYFESVRVVIAWCELRAGFRHFRTDRIRALRIQERYPARRADLLRRWQKEELPRFTRAPPAEAG